MDQVLNFWEAYPSLAFDSENLRLQTVTGDSSLRCAVSFVSLSIVLLHPNTPQSALSWLLLGIELTLKLGHTDTINLIPLMAVQRLHMLLKTI